MVISKVLKKDTLILIPEGSLNTVTSPELEKVIKDSIKGVATLILDFAKVHYLSSSGLRTLLIAQKIMNLQGKMIVRNINDDIMNILNMTGFINILTIE